MYSFMHLYKHIRIARDKKMIEKLHESYKLSDAISSKKRKYGQETTENIACGKYRSCHSI
jgi:hypothetical protein